MLAKCGEILVWHWAHSPVRRCDPWWENETDWHRKWKDYFPHHWQEVVHFDENGEKHIADIKTHTGLVIELQHSSMNPEELRRREKFYGNMLWVVDGSPFKNNFHILSRLPPADSELANRLKIVRPPCFPLDPKHPRFKVTNPPLFLLDSHQVGRVENYVIYDVLRIDGDADKSYSHPRDTEAEIDATYNGDHFLQWERPRTVWLSTSKPVLVDLGEGILWHLNKFQTRYLAAKAVSAKVLVEQLGGKWR
jgi:competence protein CoiA